MLLLIAIILFALVIALGISVALDIDIAIFNIVTSLSSFKSIIGGQVKTATYPASRRGWEGFVRWLEDFNRFHSIFISALLSHRFHLYISLIFLQIV